MTKVDYKTLLEDAKRQKAEAEAVIAFAERQLGTAKSSSGPSTAPSPGGTVEIEPDTFHNKQSELLPLDWSESLQVSIKLETILLPPKKPEW